MGPPSRRAEWSLQESSLLKNAAPQLLLCLGSGLESGNHLGPLLPLWFEVYTRSPTNWPIPALIPSGSCLDNVHWAGGILRPVWPVPLRGGQWMLPIFPPFHFWSYPLYPTLPPWVRRWWSLMALDLDGFCPDLSSSGMELGAEMRPTVGGWLQLHIKQGHEGNLRNGSPSPYFWCPLSPHFLQW